MKDARMEEMLGRWLEYTRVETGDAMIMGEMDDNRGLYTCLKGCQIVNME